jgi:hypothetical protein
LSRMVTNLDHDLLELCAELDLRAHQELTTYHEAVRY